MSTLFSRRTGLPTPTLCVSPRIGSFFLNVLDNQLCCLNETGGQLLREGLPVASATLDAQPLLNLDGTALDANVLPLLTSWREGADEAVYLWPRLGTLSQLLTWTTSPVRSADGELIGISGTAVVTVREPDWQELAGLAHDLRSPLQALKLLVPLAESLECAKTRGEIMHRIEGASSQALGIASELLDWCKAPLQARQRCVREWHAMASLLHATALEHESLARKKGISLHTDFTLVAGMEILTNKLRLERIVSNLLTNAVRYTQAGQVQLTCQWRPNASDHSLMVAIVVEDTGQGMSEEEHDSIFQPFHRGRAGLGEIDSGGSGLGLASVDRLVGDLGLTLEVFSQSGTGSRFELLVPGDLIRRPS
jgi:signal transduction histidine kinase